MRGSLKIRQLVFGEKGISLIVQRHEDDAYFHCPIAELFNNDWLLADFDAADIRLIGYFTALEEDISDRNFLRNNLDQSYHTIKHR